MKKFNNIKQIHGQLVVWPVKNLPSFGGGLAIPPAGALLNMDAY